MRLLVLGGTIFLGRAIVEAARSVGYDVTIFHRGKHNAPVLQGVESILGDRESDLSKLEGRRWDAVVDTCGYVPRVVRRSVETLRGAVDRYVFVSTISVYAKFTAGLDEIAPVGTLAVPTEEVTGETYGALKALCEDEVRRAVGDRACIVRPGLIVGPNDPTDRFTYWVRPHELAPGDPQQRVQFVDARDLAAWIVRATQLSGTFNATGPRDPLSMESFLRACAPDAKWTWVNERYLLEHNVTPFTEMPLWVPSADRAFSEVSCARAIVAGLEFRPLAQTIADTRAWDEGRGTLKAGLSPAREAELLRAFASAEASTERARRTE